MAAFELNVRAYSPWMDAFTLDEWVAYGYLTDLTYYYCFGSVSHYLLNDTLLTYHRPGDPYSFAVGQVYANATRFLMEAGPQEGSMFYSLYVPPLTHNINLPDS